MYGASRADGNAVVAAIRQQYGTLGPAYIKALQDINVRQVYNGFFKELLKLDTTEKQAMAIALMLTADAILQWRFMPDLTPLSIDDVKPLVKSKKEIDVAERAYSVVMDWIGEHANAFANSADETMRATSMGRLGRDSLPSLSPSLKEKWSPWDLASPPSSGSGLSKEGLKRITREGISSLIASVDLGNDG